METYREFNEYVLYEINYYNRIKIKETFRYNNDLCEKLFYNSGLLRSVKYYKNGKLFDLYVNIPAVTYFHPNGIIEEVIFYWSGKIHRFNKPAVIKYNDSGKIIEEIYYRHGRIYGEDDYTPAIIQYHNNGQTKKVVFYHKNGFIHRHRKPAIIKYDINGKTAEELYYTWGTPLNAKKIDTKKECSICLCECSNTIVTNCFHEFCIECLNLWMKRDKTCPNCREKL